MRSPVDSHFSNWIDYFDISELWLESEPQVLREQLYAPLVRLLERPNFDPKYIFSLLSGLLCNQERRIQRYLLTVYLLEMLEVEQNLNSRMVRLRYFFAQDTRFASVSDFLSHLRAENPINGVRENAPLKLHNRYTREIQFIDILTLDYFESAGLVDVTRRESEMLFDLYRRSIGGVLTRFHESFIHPSRISDFHHTCENDLPQQLRCSFDSIIEGYISEKNKNYKFVNLSFILSTTIIYFSTYIKDSKYNESHGFVRRILAEALRPLWAISDLAASKQDEALDELASSYLEILGVEHIEAFDAVESSWAKRVSGKAPLLDLSIFKRLPIPATAPAIWRDDKLPGDKPPDFLKRHYGTGDEENNFSGLDILRADGTGLRRNDLRHLDDSLETAMANYLRTNELPRNCPLPTKSEVTDIRALSLEKLDSKELTDLSKEIRRTLENLRHRESRNK